MDKDKIVMCEDVCGNGGIAPPFLTLALDEGHFHAPTALHLGQEPLVPIG
jgi:hypothetical protein